MWRELKNMADNLNIFKYANDNNIKIINTTPHDIDLFDDDEKTVLRTFKHDEDELIRMKENHKKMDDVGDVKRIGLSFEKAKLPPEEDGVYYIVSNLIANACKDRKDLLTPALTVRDKDGNIIGCRALGVML